jgi:uncharacterized protein
VAAILMCITAGLSCLFGSAQLFGQAMQAQAEQAQLAEADADSDGVVDADTDGTAAGPTDPVSGFDAMVQANFDPNQDVWRDAERAAYREGPWSEVMLFRAVTYGFAFISAIFGYGWRILGMFLIGAGLMKVRFFAPEHRSWHKRMAVLGLSIGLPLEIAAGTIMIVTHHEIGAPWVLANTMHELGSFALCLGYVGTITLVAGSAIGGVLRPISSVGRMALSTYLLETLVTTTIMYWYGLAWFGEVSRVGQLGLVVVIYAGLIVFSVIWIRVFRIGPFEWLWRSLTYLRPQPILRERSPG